MRTSHWLLLPGLSLFLASVLTAQQPSVASAPRQQPAGKAGVPRQPATPHAAAPQAPLRAIATVKDIMDGLVDPASDAVFDAVGTVVTLDSTVEKFPKNDEEWAAVRKGALMMTEGANLLMIGGRHIARPHEKSENPQIELEPVEIEARVAKDRPAWIKLAQGLFEAGSQAVKAAEAKDVEALLAAGDTLDTACENCHLRYWYPDQVEALDRADRNLRAARSSRDKKN